MAAVEKVLDPAANKQTSLTTMNSVSGVFSLLCLVVLGFGCFPSWWQAPVVEWCSVALVKALPTQWILMWQSGLIALCSDCTWSKAQLLILLQNL